MLDTGKQDGSVAAIPGSCTVVVPCYNEALRMQPDLYSSFLQTTDSIHFLFVNDGSHDGTLAILKALRERHPKRVDVLDVQPNGGKAEAVRKGLVTAMAAGKSSYVGFWDADLATPLNAIPQLLQVIQTEPQVQMIFASRVRLLGRKIDRKPLRHYLGRCFATGVSVLFQLPIYDSQCGAKIFRVTPDLAKVLATPFLSRWIFDVEIIARFLALHHGDTRLMEEIIYEFPLTVWTDVGGSKVGPMAFFNSFYELLNIFRKYREDLRAKSH